ncbi:MAG: hypothetical protein LBL27_04830, partial [Coriobacteriales bacterium]|nr:hypothetical protein [Coriobacteriales bacterium]
MVNAKAKMGQHAEGPAKTPKKATAKKNEIGVLSRVLAVILAINIATMLAVPIGVFADVKADVKADGEYGVEYGETSPTTTPAEETDSQAAQAAQTTQETVASTESSSEAAVESAGSSDNAGLSDIALTPILGARSAISPLAVGDANVASWDELIAAIKNTSVRRIFLTKSFGRTGGTGSDYDLPFISRSLVIDGTNPKGGVFTLDFRNNNTTTAIDRNSFRLGSAGAGATLTLQNIA